jgi:hypothetical protein
MMIACSIPLSNYVMSMGGIFLSVNWFVEWNWGKKWELLKANRLAIVLSLFFFVCCFCLIKTDNWSVGIDNLLSKLPLLYTPIIMATSKPLDGRAQRIIILGFIGAVLFGTIYSFIYLLTHEIADIREISVFISHIRFSLCIVLAIFIGGFMSLKVKHYPKIIRALFLLISLWFVAYLFIAQTLTGIVIFVIITLFLLFRMLLSHKKNLTRKIIISVFTLLVLGFAVYTTYIIYDYYSVKIPLKSQLETTTKEGHIYHNDLNSIVENGSLIYLYVCEEELRTEWSKRSNLAYDDNIETTLIRYLNSKGLRKDKEGMETLTNEDINNIELGIANVEYSRGFGIKRSIYPLLFSLTLYKQSNKIDHSSLLQRIELWKAGFHVIKSNALLGVGIGDHKTALDKQLITQNSSLTYKREMGCHNQFITYCLMGGIFLLTYFLFTLFYPFFAVKKSWSIIYIIFFITIFISLFTEDTLETQAGMTLYAFFNSFLLLNFDEIKLST